MRTILRRRPRRMPVALGWLLGMALPLAAQSALAQTGGGPSKSGEQAEQIDLNSPKNLLYLDLPAGRVVIRMRPDKAPNHVARIKELTRRNFYDGLIFHRVIDGFMAQTGDPTGTGTGGSSLPDLKAEFNDLMHLRGTVSMARTDDPDSANSQFFIMFQPRSSLDDNYTVWGRVVRGMEHVDAIARGEPPAEPTQIVRMRVAADVIDAPQTSDRTGEDGS